ncbi:hypothetical protein ISN75_19865 [Dyella marensis]|uniref:ketosteroid isomerase family protein n=1 Tax=Dyella marensis TaxID=500610 RepID=UPI0031D2F096
MGGDTGAIAKDYCLHYYYLLQSNPQALSTLYIDSSLLNFEGGAFEGVGDIVQKLQSLPAATYDLANIESQPSVNGGVCIFVEGCMLLNQQPLHFFSSFLIVPDASGGNF